MAEVPVDDEEIDELLVELVTGDRTDYDVARDLLEASLQYDSAVQAEVVETLSQQTNFNKSTLRETRDDIQQEQSLDRLTVLGIEKVLPYDQSEPVIYEFEVEAQGDHATFSIPSDELMSPTTFERKVLELTDTKVSYEDWDGLLNNWLNEHDIEERKEEAISKEHGVVESVVDRIRGMEATDDYDDFRQNRQHVYCDFEANEALVPGEVVQQATREVRGETNTQKIRAILDDLMVDGESRKVRVEDDYFRAWRFNLQRLRDADVLETSNLDDEPADETDDNQNE